MFTYQDFIRSVNANGMSVAINTVINNHKSSEVVNVALDADAYDRQMNTTISNYIRMLYSSNGQRMVDRTSSNNKLCSSFFRRLNTQRMSYSLGNGVSFSDNKIKEMLGIDFDTKLRDAGYYALIHGTSFLFWNIDHVHVFPITEFAPLWDEETGELKAGVRYWRIDSEKPMIAVLYEVDGFTKFRKAKDSKDFEVVVEKRAYRMTVEATPMSEEEVVGEENYSELPIIPVYGSRLKQSTLVGMKGSIDAYDLVRSGFANDLSDCSEIYWIVSNAGGMDDKDLAKFRDRLKLNHIANVQDGDDVSVTPYTQEIPYASRKEFLESIRAGIYEDFGGLDVHTIASGATNDHIDAGYQPMDENADDFEYQIIQSVQQLLRLIGVEDTPIFKRNRISNQKEQCEMILSCANYLDDETILNKLPFITTDEVQEILDRKDVESFNNFNEVPTESEEVDVNE